MYIIADGQLLSELSVPHGFTWYPTGIIIL